MKQWLPFLTTLLGLWASLAEGQAISQVAAGLEKQAVVLRNFYVDEKLIFDSDGKLISTGSAGYGPIDGRIYIEQVKLGSEKLTLIGKRTAPMYDRNIDSFWLATLKVPVKVEIKLSPGISEQQLVSLLKKIFVPQPELDQLKCSTDSAKAFQDSLPGHRDPNAPPKPKEPNVQTLQELNPLCFPDGEKAYRVGRGVTAPKALHAPDPSYAERARQNKLQGTVILTLIIDTLGRPSTLMVTRPLGEGLDEKAVEAVRKWKFAPATFQGQPVPVTVIIEVNFRLY